MSDIKLPRLPNVQVPRIDADVSLIDIRGLAKWCQRVATEYARAAVEADRADRAQQEAPTDAEWPAPHSVETVRDANGRARRGSDLYTREAVEEIIAIELGRARFDPAQDAERERDVAFLQEADQHALHRFIETTEDDEGYDIGKDAVKRLAELGVVSNHGFGRYGVTAFGYWVHERYWHQNPSLPLMTNSDRDEAARAQRAAAQGDGDGR